MRSAITCGGFTPTIRRRASISAFAGGWHRCSANSRRKIELLNILLFSHAGNTRALLRRRNRDGRQLLPRRSQWRAHPDAMERRSQRRIFARRIRSSSICRLRLIRNTTTKRSTSKMQQKNLSSLLWWMRRVIAMRKNYKAFSPRLARIFVPGKSQSAGISPPQRRRNHPGCREFVPVRSAGGTRSREIFRLYSDGSFWPESFSRRPKIALSSYARAARALLVCIAVSLGGNPGTETHENTYHRIGAGIFRASFRFVTARSRAHDSSQLPHWLPMVWRESAHDSGTPNRGRSPGFVRTRLARDMSSLK